MKQFWILALFVALLAGTSPAEADADQYYREGQRLFGERNFQAALEQFQQADAMVPKEPQIYSWIGASLNELGKHAEAERRLEEAIEILREAQQVAAARQQPAQPIDLGYFLLLASIRVNLHKFEQAVEAVNSFSFNDDGSEEATKAKQAFDGAKQTVRAKLVAVGTECLRSSDLDCTRKALVQAEILLATPSAWESFARESLTRAEKAPATTDEDKAKRAQLFDMAVQASRLWAEQGGSPEAQRLLARSLSSTKTRESCEEAARILTTLWESSPDPAQRDSAIQLELCVAYAGLEQWELARTAASTFIQLNPTDPRGQGYCQRSFAQFQLGHCPEAIDDGARCKNADGTPRPLKHVEVCQQRIAKQEADKAEAEARAQEAALQRRCAHLYERLKWARGFYGELPLEEAVDILGDLKASEGECKPHLDAAERRDSGSAFSSPAPALCAAGAKTASSPLNLSMASKEELEALRAKTQQLMRLCKSSWDAGQTTSVEGGLRMVEQAIARHG